MKKIISLFTVVAFIIFSLSCHSTKNIKLDADAPQKVKKGDILRVVMTSGETIEFSKDQPGRIHNESITGEAVRVTGELDKAYIKSKVVDKKGKILRIRVSIPLSEVEMVRAKMFNLGKTFLVFLGFCAGVGIGFVAIMAAIVASDES